MMRIKRENWEGGFDWLGDRKKGGLWADRVDFDLSNRLLPFVVSLFCYWGERSPLQGYREMCWGKKIRLQISRMLESDGRI